MKQAYKILGFALLLLSPIIMESGNRIFPFIGIFTGAFLLYKSKDKDDKKNYLENMKFLIPLLIGVVLLGYIIVKLWFKFQAGEWPFVY